MQRGLNILIVPVFLLVSLVLTNCVSLKVYEAKSVDMTYSNSMKRVQAQTQKLIKDYEFKRFIAEQLLKKHKTKPKPEIQKVGELYKGMTNLKTKMLEIRDSMALNQTKVSLLLKGKKEIVSTDDEYHELEKHIGDYESYAIQFNSSNQLYTRESSNFGQFLINNRLYVEFQVSQIVVTMEKRLDKVKKWVNETRSEMKTKKSIYQKISRKLGKNTNIDSREMDSVYQLMKETQNKLNSNLSSVSVALNQFKGKHGKKRKISNVDQGWEDFKSLRTEFEYQRSNIEINLQRFDRLSNQFQTLYYIKRQGKG